MGLLPADYTMKSELDVRTVLNALFLFWLLEDYNENGLTLELDHSNTPSQAARLEKGLEERNARMAGSGQEEWNHACNLCCWIQGSDDDDPDSNDSVSDFYFALICT
jgi:hypothetical protein